MKIFHYQDAKAEDYKDGAEKTKVRWLITKDLGAKNFAMRIFEIEPDGFSPLHSHPWEHEIFAFEGNGVVFDGRKERKFREGYVIYIAPNEMHQLKNMGEKTLKFLCLIPYLQK